MNENYVTIITFDKINVSKDVMLIYTFLRISVKTLWNYINELLLSSKSFLCSPKTQWLIGTGGYITVIRSENWYEQIPSLSGQHHCILHAFDYYQFSANLKQFQTPF